jgi:CheY-like chemotaxis protein
VITDVIMPEKDGYEVCQYIKNHPALAKTPVILMSGVVNRAVAEKAFAVKADELLRKPFQPQDLITRVKYLLKPNGHHTSTAASAASAAAALTSIFSAAAAQQARAAAQPVPISSGRPITTAQSMHPPAAPTPPAPIATPSAAAPKAQGSGDLAKMKIEILRLENLVKKLQSELVAEREYSRALEAHLKTLQDAE